MGAVLQAQHKDSCQDSSRMLQIAVMLARRAGRPPFLHTVSISTDDSGGVGRRQQLAEASSWTATTTDGRHGSTSSRPAHNCGQNSCRSRDGRTFERSFLSRELFPSLKDLRVSQGVRFLVSEHGQVKGAGTDEIATHQFMPELGSEEKELGAAFGVSPGRQGWICEGCRSGVAAAGKPGDKSPEASGGREEVQMAQEKERARGSVMAARCNSCSRVIAHCRWMFSTKPFLGEAAMAVVMPA
ncbi:hypothetical protein Anapl_01550 [Anas platyrhynchos]|uniref:Uncharacterized protein n=1 Tax=Anas platyrhynchos TaxID=8839 RepID=R0L883_ANAPL|nr:hypothetical protein Anapl_01550 [Anas platyrhynchos]